MLDVLIIVLIFFVLDECLRETLCECEKSGQMLQFCLLLPLLFIDQSQNLDRTRMHSSRMRTGRTLTVFRKLETPPKIWSRHPAPPPKIWNRHPPPKIWSRHPPKKFGTCTPPKIWSRHPPRKFGAGTPPKKFGADPPKIWSRHPPPPPVDRHTLVKILPWPKLRFGR